MRTTKIERTARFTDSFVRKTFYIDETLLDIIQELASNRYGEQTRIIDAALRAYLSDPKNIEKHAGSTDWWRKDFWKELKIGPVEER